MDRRIALVVEDDADIGDAIGEALGLAGFEVTVVGNGEKALAALSAHPPDLVTLDLSLPDIDGLELCRRIRLSSDCYIIMVSARHAEVDKLTGLAAGADDFITKPFSLRELQARVAALFRRPRRTDPEQSAVPARPDVLDGGAGLTVDRGAREVRVDGATVELTRTEFDLLAHLVSRPGVVIGRDELLRAVWSTAFVPEDTHNVDVHLANLRRKLRRHSDVDWVRTVRGVGLRFDRG